MTYLIEKSKKALKEGGLPLLIKRSINFSFRKCSPLLPQVYRKYNGVKVPSHKLFGKFIPFIETKNRPNYEQGLINSLEENVKKGDKIIVCGGGVGVTAVKAAFLNKSPSKVSVYEGSKSQLEKIEETLNINDVSDIELNHAIIGEEKNIWGSSKGAKTISPEDLPDCDILELDIEGSEIGVLKNLEINPRTIIVETHGNKGAPAEKVKQILLDKEYEITNIELAEKNEHAEKNDIKVITAKS